MKELSPALRSLLSGTPPALGPGPRAGVEEIGVLNRRVDEAVHVLGLDARRRELVRALVLLWHDHHEAAHHIVQELEDQDGSYIHAILHRREPDYSNAKYWFRRVGVHACFAELAAQAAPILRQAPDARVAALAATERWNPNAFVDACEAVQDDEPSAKLLRQAQAVEFVALLSALSD